MLLPAFGILLASGLLIWLGLVMLLTQTEATRMDLQKCESLKTELESEAEPLVPIGRFFEGNDDPGSIGCNLLDHPGIDRFREILVGLTKRPDVQAVYAQITELDPGDDSWPFTDTVLVVGNIDQEVLADLVEPLEPDEVGPAATEVREAIGKKHNGQVSVLWWD